VGREGGREINNNRNCFVILQCHGISYIQATQDEYLLLQSRHSSKSHDLYPPAQTAFDSNGYHTIMSTSIRVIRLERKVGMYSWKGKVTARRTCGGERSMGPLSVASVQG
jgi:hypothetical protein